MNGSQGDHRPSISIKLLELLNPIIDYSSQTSG